jgi:tRNA(Ile)-lysidine synthase
VAGEEGADAVLLGHTLDDQAETVLLGLARGSGARSLAGMPARRGLCRRPLLDLPRAVTHDACAALGLEPVLDPSNSDPRYTRARVRSALAVLRDALGPELPAALARTATLLAEDAAALDAAAAELLTAAGGLSGLSCEVLARAPDAVRRRALLAAARSAGSAAGSLSRRHALALDALVVRWRGQGPVHLPGGVLAARRCGTLCFAPRGTGRRREPQEDRAAE